MSDPNERERLIERLSKEIFYRHPKGCGDAQRCADFILADRARICEPLKGLRLNYVAPPKCNTPMEFIRAIESTLKLAEL